MRLNTIRVSSKGLSINGNSTLSEYVVHLKSHYSIKSSQIQPFLHDDQVYVSEVL